MPRLSEYKPLVAVLTGIVLAVAVVMMVSGQFDVEYAMRLFMSFFFLVFGLFKLLDLKGFAMAFAEYDVVALKSRTYALLYPFIELGLGAGYFLLPNLMLINWITIIILGISSVGVARALLNRQRLHCACLGAVVKLPMTTVTLVEDVGMVVMAALMLAL